MKIAHSILLIIGLSLVASACGPTQQSLNAKRQAVSNQRTAVQAAKNALKASDMYAQFLKKKKGIFWAISAKQLTRLTNTYLPYPFKGKHLNKKRLKGNFKFHKARNVRIHPDNRITFRMSFAAQGVRANLKGVMGATKAHARKIKQAMEGGGHFDVQVFGHIGRGGKYLVIKGNCTGVTLKKHNTKRHREMLRDGVNKKFLNSPQYIPLPKGLSGKSVKLVTTPHHFVFLKK